MPHVSHLAQFAALLWRYEPIVPPDLPESLVLITSFISIAGLPILEQLRRTRQMRIQRATR
jgi:hypothetical protein